MKTFILIAISFLGLAAQATDMQPIYTAKNKAEQKTIKSCEAAALEKIRVQAIMWNSDLMPESIRATGLDKEMFGLQKYVWFEALARRQDTKEIYAIDKMTTVNSLPGSDCN